MCQCDVEMLKYDIDISGSMRGSNGKRVGALDPLSREKAQGAQVKMEVESGSTKLGAQRDGKSAVTLRRPDAGNCAYRQ